MANSTEAGDQLFADALTGLVRTMLEDRGISVAHATVDFARQINLQDIKIAVRVTETDGESFEAIVIVPYWEWAQMQLNGFPVASVRLLRQRIGDEIDRARGVEPPELPKLPADTPPQITAVSFHNAVTYALGAAGMLDTRGIDTSSSFDPGWEDSGNAIVSVANPVKGGRSTFADVTPTDRQLLQDYLQRMLAFFKQEGLPLVMANGLAAARTVSPALLSLPSRVTEEFPKEAPMPKKGTRRIML